MFHTYKRIGFSAVILAMTGMLASCSWWYGRQLQQFGETWVPLRDSVFRYTDSINYLPRQATTYLDMMYQDTLFFSLFSKEDIDQLVLTRKQVEAAGQELNQKRSGYLAMTRTAEAADLTYEQWQRYLAGKASEPPATDISTLTAQKDSLQAALQILKAEHRRLFDAIRLNFFMHKDLHQNLMKPHWDSLYAQQAEKKALNNYPAQQ